MTDVKLEDDGLHRNVGLSVSNYSAVDLLTHYESVWVTFFAGSLALSIFELAGSSGLENPNGVLYIK
jgi:hypothetical protein